MKFEQNFMEENKDSEDLDEDDKYLQKLDAGLFTLQLVDFMILDICANGSVVLKDRVMKILNMRGGSSKFIKNVMKEFADNLGTADQQNSAKSASDSNLTEEQQRIYQLIDKF